MAKLTKAVKKSREVVAWEEWLASDIGKQCQEFMNVQGEYLQNRLWYAFMDGFRAGEKRTSPTP